MLLSRTLFGRNFRPNAARPSHCGRDCSGKSAANPAIVARSHQARRELSVIRSAARILRIAEHAKVKSNAGRDPGRIGAEL
jgi:hypothetical protein